MHGAIPAVISAEKAKRCMILARPNANEASLVSNAKTYFASSLLQVVNFLNRRDSLPIAQEISQNAEEKSPLVSRDLTDIIGQQHAKRALMIAASGQHNLLFLGPPGTGKTMLASRLADLLPEMSDSEAIETASVSSLVQNELGKHAHFVRRIIVLQWSR